MGNTAIIGPITINSAHKPDDKLGVTINNNSINSFNTNIISPKGTTEHERSFTIRMENHELKQLQGLAQQRQPVWIDSSTSLTDNEHPQHKGWVMLNRVDLNEHLGPNNVNVNIEYTPIQTNPNTYLEMSYTSGNNDGTEISHGYTDTTQNYNLQVTPFTTFDTANTWYPTVTPSNFTGVATTPISNKLNIIGASTSGGVPSGAFTVTRESYVPPFTFECNLEIAATPTSGNYYGNYHLYNVRPSTYAAYDPFTMNAIDWIGLYLEGSASGVSYFVYKDVANVRTPLVSSTFLSGTNRLVNFKVEQTASLTTIYIDENNSGSWTKIWGPASTGISYASGAYITYALLTSSTTSRTVRSSYAEIYDYAESSKPNVVALPLNCTPTETTSFYRNSIPCFVTPSDNLFFITSTPNVYNGSVKVYNTNNSNSTPRQVFGTDDIFTASSAIIDNNIIKIRTDTDGVIFSYATAGTWVDFNEFKPGGNITTVEVDENSPERARLQVNQTYWEIQRGKPFVYVYHPNTNLTYTAPATPCYQHDGVTTTTPGAGANISMLTNFYCNIWNCGTGNCATPNPTDNIRLSIYQKEPTTIKSDSIPAANLTGIGFYNNTTPNTDPDGYLFNAREFFKKPENTVKIVKP